MREAPGPDVLRGPLSDVFMPALMEGSLPALARRLGDRATLCDPRFGAADGGMITKRLEELRGAWSGFSIEKERIVAGVERDVWIGTLTSGARIVTLALCVERRRMREIELRMVHAHDAPYVFTHAKRDPTTLPTAVEHVLGALASGDASGLHAQLETQATLMTSRGETFTRDDAAGFIKALRGDGPFSLVRHGSADDGRFTALELTVTRGGTANAWVFIASRGESGLLTSLRIVG